MQISEISSVAQSALEWLVDKGAVPALMVVGILLWAMARTGSSHLVTSRLWQLAIGKREVTQTELSEYLGQRDELMRFRLQTGLRQAGTNQQARRIVSWVNQHDVDIDLVSACGDYFDVEVPAPKKDLPGPAWRFAVAVLASALFYAVLVRRAAG
jgi:hypothetical protein